jgi:hypothetical protein
VDRRNLQRLERSQAKALPRFGRCLKMGTTITAIWRAALGTWLS